MRNNRINRSWQARGLPLMLTWPLIACAPKPLQVVAAPPPVLPKPQMPEFLKMCPPVPSWYPPTTCKPAQP